MLVRIGRAVVPNLCMLAQVNVIQYNTCIFHRFVLVHMINEPDFSFFAVVLAKYKKIDICELAHDNSV